MTGADTFVRLPSDKSPSLFHRCCDFTTFVVVLLCAAAFLFSALRHFTNQFSFQQAISDYDLVPAFLIPIVAGILPALQLLLACALLQNAFRTIAMHAMTMILISFACIHWITLARGLKISCGCFGESDDHVTLRSAVLVSLLALACGLSLCWTVFQKRLSWAQLKG